MSQPGRLPLGALCAAAAACSSRPAALPSPPDAGADAPAIECAPGDLRGATCASLGFACGDLRCAAAGRFDTSGCLEPIRNLSQAAAPPRSANAGSWSADISADGRLVVFASAASNLVAGDADPYDDLFLHDLATGETRLVDPGPDVRGASGPSLSDDGRFVAFADFSADGRSRVLVYDRAEDRTTLIAPAPGDSPGRLGAFWSSISGDGSVVAFVTDTPPPDVPPDASDSFAYAVVHDTRTGETRYLGGSSWFPRVSMSAGGRRVAFSTYAALVEEDGDDDEDVYVHDLADGSLRMLPGAAGGADLPSQRAISADGERVLYEDDDGIALHDLATDRTWRVASASPGEVREAALSRDGEIVALSTRLPLAGEEADGAYDIYLYDAGTGVTEAVTAAGAGGGAPDRHARRPALSASGRQVVFDSDAVSLDPADGSYQVYVHDTASGATTRVSAPDLAVGRDPPQPDGWSWQARPTGGGVLFLSAAGNLVAGDDNGRTDFFLTGSGGAPPARFDLGDAIDTLAVASRRPAVALLAERNDIRELEVRFLDEQRAVPLPDAVTFAGMGERVAALDAAGGQVAFLRGEWGRTEVFVLDLVSSAEERVSVLDGGVSLAVSSSPAMSADGRIVAFSSVQVLPEEEALRWGIFVRDRDAGVTLRVSVAPDGGWPDDFAQAPAVSADGTRVAFLSTATNLVEGDDGGLPDIFVYDIATGETRIVDLGSGLDAFVYSGETYFGQSYTWVPFASFDPVLSPDGSRVAFASVASDLVPGDTNGEWDVFVHELDSARTRRVSVAADEAEGQFSSWDPAWSADGRYLSFSSAAANLTDDTGDVALGRVYVVPMCP